MYNLRSDAGRLSAPLRGKSITVVMMHGYAGSDFPQEFISKGNSQVGTAPLRRVEMSPFAAAEGGGLGGRVLALVGRSGNGLTFCGD